MPIAYLGVLQPERAHLTHRCGGALRGLNGTRAILRTSEI